MKKNLVIGVGEIGTAIRTILNCEAIDILLNSKQKKRDVIHICFPCSDPLIFIEEVKRYKKMFDAELVIIHSTVPVGTTEKIGDFAVHSPVRGVHPHLEKGIRTFCKYFGGSKAKQASEQFPMLSHWCTKNSRDTELMKLVDTTVYGINILMQKEIKRLCEENDSDFFLVYTHANATYNSGYDELGMPRFSKYVLEDYPGKIGGHCIMPNIELFDSWMCDLLKKENKNL